MSRSEKLYDIWRNLKKKKIQNDQSVEVKSKTGKTQERKDEAKEAKRVIMKPPLSHMNLFEFYQESTEEQSDYFKQKSNLSFSFGKKL